MINELTEKEYQETFGTKMTEITTMEIDHPVDIWGYVKELVDANLVGEIVYERAVVEFVYRDNNGNYDHVLLPTSEKNIYTVIVVDLKRNCILGHKTLDLIKEYGLSD